MTLSRCEGSAWAPRESASKPPSIIDLVLFFIVIGLFCWSGFEAGECSESFTGVKNQRPPEDCSFPFRAQRPQPCHQRHNQYRSGHLHYHTAPKGMGCRAIL